MDPGPYEEIARFLEKAALLAGDLEQRCDAAAARHAQSASEFEAVLRRVQDSLGSQLARTRRELADLTGDAAAQGLDELRGFVDQLRREQADAGDRMRTMGWSSIIAVGAAALLAIAGSSFIVWDNARRIGRDRVQAEVLDALRHVTITSCGGQPCIRLADGQPRWERNPDYVIVDASAQGGAAGSRPSAPGP